MRTLRGGPHGQLVLDYTEFGDYPSRFYGDPIDRPKTNLLSSRCGGVGEGTDRIADLDSES